ncbi:MAG TPA: serine/threonine-protein kinase [Rhodocyclaceae bacterium]|nr:serine/threonine-protein kinase [Rhodocyclaceae bacterium]
MTTTQINHALPPGFQLDRYRIERQISLGGFSIVYLAYDDNETPVAIKEYLPNTLALRAEGAILPEIRDEHRAAFNHGLKCFFEEGRALARLNHPNVVRVLNFFRANATVYMVMQYEEGHTLREHVMKKTGKVSENFMRIVFSRLLNGLREVHTQRILHLDIKPSNIYLRTDGNPVLLDFGASRQALENDAPSLRPTYTPGFAAPEQYEAQDTLGPWTDIYAIGATMYACLAHSSPPASNQRVENDTLVPAARRWQGKYSEQLLGTIDWCMQIDRQKRPMSVFALQKNLMDPPGGKQAARRVRDKTQS